MHRAVSGRSGDRRHGVRHDPLTFYFGGTGGGVWKTTDGGSNWENVSDKDFKTGSVGAIAVSESDPNVVYVGMGEAADPGQRLARRRRLEVHRRRALLEERRTEGHAADRADPDPSDEPDIVYVAALGHVWGPNPERGIFRSRDGGKTWTKVLFVDEKTGASDLSMDPNNPRVLYAGFWQVVRRPWELVSGGPGSALYRSADGGDTWKKLTAADNDGLPEGIWGKVGVAASAARSRAASTRSSRRTREASSSARTAARSGSTSTTSTRSASAPGTTPGSTPIRRTRTRSTCRASICTSPPTAGRRSRTCRCRTGTTTTSGSTRTIRSG